MYSFMVRAGLAMPDDRVLAKAKDTNLEFRDGTRARCMTSGLWNVSFGYGNEIVRSAIEDSLDQYSYGTLFRYSHAAAEQVSEKLLALAGQSFTQTMFATSGGSALDLASKMVREAQRRAGRPRQEILVTLKGSYHGTTMGSLALTGEELGQENYKIDKRRVRHVSVNSLPELQATLDALGDRVAGFIIEPLLGSYGYLVDQEFLALIYSHRRKYSSFLVADEVATGFHRCGPLFLSSTWKLPPDIIVASKALTNGTTASSVLFLGRYISQCIEQTNEPLLQGETQAGDAISCGAIEGVLRVIMQKDYKESALKISKTIEGWFEQEIQLLGDAVLLGCGAFWYLRFPSHLPDAASVVKFIDKLRLNGVVVHPGIQGIGLMPALSMQLSHLEDALSTVGREFKCLLS